MEPTSPSVIEAERYEGGVLITFDDGKCAAYSASLLRAVFDQAREITNTADTDWTSS
jgi:hypothetical protein